MLAFILRYLPAFLRAKHTFTVAEVMAPITKITARLDAVANAATVVSADMHDAADLMHKEAAAHTANAAQAVTVANKLNALVSA